MKPLHGFSLIEVLVALVVLSIGMLGIAALHIDGVRTGYSALQRTHAVNLTADMADRIRANPAGNYNVGVGAAGAAPGVACADTASGAAPGDCTPDQMAAYDVWEWRSAIEPSAATGLPGGAGRIDLDTATDPDSLVITVSWSDKGQTRDYRLTVQQ
ncbi:MAG: type IV pilus modification protein PilV [Gammaproteobacteria bacterium]|nr:type IV pilus modification protein PilV [Gammaproteobacteria bacterium]NNM20315.1 type IV pilus modification protein PilV [Gammaproteobacteria bacterium]